MSDMSVTESDYHKYRGKCREFAQQAVEADPLLRLVRGHYYCPLWGPQAHWWTVRPDGKIHDPTKDQFPSKGLGEYVEFDGFIDCEECGKRVSEMDAYIDGHHAFCSGQCFGRYVGLC